MKFTRPSRPCAGAFPMLGMAATTIWLDSPTDPFIFDASWGSKGSHAVGLLDPAPREHFHCLMNRD